MNEGKFYAGIGSRETPARMQVVMNMLAYELGDAGWTLRSGAAQGADSAFEAGLGADHLREIYLPWKGFNGHPSTLWRPSQEAYALAAELHPAWARLSAGARKLHARNCKQILGDDLQTPVAFVACWTPDGGGGGGTGQAIRLALSRDIPVFDLGKDPKVRDEIRDFVHEYDRERRLRP